LAGLEVLRSFKEQKIETHAPVTVINWTNEEGARFVPSLGASSVWAEEHSVEEIHASTTHDGSSLTMGDELRRIGYVGDTASTFSKFPLSVHFELHNEQNTELEEAGKSVGYATGYQAVAGYEIILDGEDGHAATYAMPKRKDALVGAAKVIAAADTAAREMTGFATATSLRTGPVGFCNIQSTAKICFLIGNLNNDKLSIMCDKMEQTVKDVAAFHGLTARVNKNLELPTGNFTKEAVDCAARGCGEMGTAITCMSGHDSLMTILKVPTAMIFVRSKDGISHSAKEWSDQQDCADGALALGRAVLNYDEFLQRK
jgi:beta-ureidopropionase / N-carbamoyl-L-amino-acid hydrolase